jgi:L-amino acid N-acyltransferase YncA
MRIRDADAERDAAACAAIYAPSVEGSHISFEEATPGAAEMARRIRSYAATHAWLVAEVEDGKPGDAEVVGYAYGCRHRERAAYRWTAEVAVYVAGDARGRGVGSELYSALAARLRGSGYRLLVAGIALPNEASVALHRRSGFRDVGVFRATGWKDGTWRDVAWMELDLAAGDDSPPAREPPGAT